MKKPDDVRRALSDVRRVRTSMDDGSFQMQAAALHTLEWVLEGFLVTPGQMLRLIRATSKNTRAKKRKEGSGE